VDLTPDDVRDILRALDSSGLDELHLELADLTLTVRREGAAGWTAEQQVVRRPAVEHEREPAVGAEPGRPHAPVPQEPVLKGPVLKGPVLKGPVLKGMVPEGMVAVQSPLPGTFYRAPKPGAPPFAEAGDKVEEDTVVGIVETMKMMTPVHAGVRGTVTGFRTGDGELAGTGTVLLVVDPAPGTAGSGGGPQ
jgi:acetyl-CoA carboxylase biotin carboxyl carrier protein